MARTFVEVLNDQDARFKRTMKLYHGSMYEQDELKPGFQHSGEVTNWDGIESNLYLYVSSNKNEAILLGIASAAEKVFKTKSASMSESERRFEITVESDSKLPTLEDVYALKVYLYTIAYQDGDKWVKNKNPYNSITTEYKTQETIRSAIISRETVNVKSILKDFKVTIKKG